MKTKPKTVERSGKSLIFTDLHVGISNDKASRQKIAENVIDEIIGRIETEGIKQVFFLGDLFHQRTAIEVTSLNVANDLVRKLASTCEVYLLQGNHDLYEKYNGEKFTVLGVATWDKPEDTKQAMEELGIKYPQIMNAQQAGSDAYNIEGIPEIILFAPDGTIVKRGLRGEAMVKAVEEALK
jgi:predicted MPP superfamily phosphohydrolase